ncbi:MAG: hypothetical protein JSR58_02920 [Verrucomicrobia bacterium]|nr:hypothetical protein [Verrucomicrobiota bacterium]
MNVQGISSSVFDVGKYALGAIAALLLYKIYRVYTAIWQRPTGNYDFMKDIYTVEPWRISTVEFRKSFNHKTFLAGDKIVCIEGSKVEEFKIDPHPYLLSGKVKKCAEKILDLEIQAHPSLIHVDRWGISWWEAGKMYRSPYGPGLKSYSLPTTPFAIAYDPTEVLIGSRGEIEKWDMNDTDPRMEVDRNVEFSRGAPITLLKKFQENDQTYLFIVRGHSFEIWNRSRDTWKESFTYSGTQTSNITACTFAEGKLFIARDKTIDVWKVREKSGMEQVLSVSHMITDLGYSDGRLFAVGDKLTVWDFRRSNLPGRIDQIWDRILRLLR